MTTCRHLALVQLPEKNNMLRCRRCHLTIDSDELGGGCCPGCFEVRGERHYDFEEIKAADKGKIRYRCEECGIIIEAD